VESSVGLAAGVALAAALPGLRFACGLATRSLLTGDVTTHSLSERDGHLPVVPAPPAPDTLAAWEIDPAPWRDRLAAAAAELGLPCDHVLPGGDSR
jgi:O-succinylbenzoate synthase